MNILKNTAKQSPITAPAITPNIIDTGICKN